MLLVSNFVNPVPSPGPFARELDLLLVLHGRKNLYGCKFTLTSLVRTGVNKFSLMRISRLKAAIRNLGLICCNQHRNRGNKVIRATNAGPYSDKQRSTQRNTATE